MAEPEGLLGNMLVGPSVKDVTREEKIANSPEEVSVDRADEIVFMRDFENTALSPIQRLDALKELIKLIRK